MFPAAARPTQLLPGQVELPESYDQPKRSEHGAGTPRPRVDGFGAENKCADEGEALRSALLDAGVSPELVGQVLASYSGAAKHFVGTDSSQGEVAPAYSGAKQVAARPSDSLPMPETASAWVPAASLQGDSASNHELSPRNDCTPLTSPFDVAMKKYVHRKRDVNTLFGRIINDDVSTGYDVEASIPIEGSACSTDRSSECDSQVVAYTFGDYFTSCVQSRRDPDLRVRAIEIVDQYALVMQETCGAMVVFEGCVALIRLSLEHSVDQRVFRAACQLACSLFEAMDDLVRSAPPVRKPSLGIVNELSREHWLPGMTRLLDGFLSSDCCWSASTTNYGQKASLNTPRTVNRHFLLWVRLLLQQSATRGAFLIVCSPTDNLRRATNNNSSLQSAAFTSVANRLRLFRLLLSTRMDRSALPGDMRERIADFCGALSRETRNIESVVMAGTLHRLAKECLQLLDHQHDPVSDTDAKKRVRAGIPRAGATPNSTVHVHCPLFRKHPLNAEAEGQLSNQLQRYNDTRPRPRALYRHNFEQCDVINANALTAMSFTKGNIHFCGVIEAREPSQSEASFRDRLAQQTRPFVLDLTTSASAQGGQSARPEQATTKTVESPFAVFRGTVERRDAIPTSYQPSVTPQIGGKLPGIGSTRRKSRDARSPPAAADIGAHALSPCVLPVSPETVACLPSLSVPASSSLPPTAAFASHQPAKTELARKPSTAQMAGVGSRQTQAARAPPQTASAKRQLGSPDKDTCFLQ